MNQSPCDYYTKRHLINKFGKINKFLGIKIICYNLTQGVTEAMLLTELCYCNLIEQG